MHRPASNPPARYLTSSQVAPLLSVSPKTVVRWAKEGRLPYAKTLGGHRRFEEATILALRDRLQVPVTNPDQNGDVS